MIYNSYNGDENLEDDGFQVFRSDIVKEHVRDFSTSLESIASRNLPKNVFRTKLGDIKQIQNLDFGFLNNILASLIGSSSFNVLNNQYFCKPPNYKMTSAHQDNAYFDSDKKIVTFWIPLQDVDVLNSCMFYVPRSHMEGLLEHKPIGTNVRTRTGKTGVSLYSDVYKNYEFVKVPMLAYNILVHDKNTMHFSSPNMSDEYRYAITCILEILD